MIDEYNDIEEPLFIDPDEIIDRLEEIADGTIDVVDDILEDLFDV